MEIMMVPFIKEIIDEEDYMMYCDPYKGVSSHDISEYQKYFETLSSEFSIFYRERNKLINKETGSLRGKRSSNKIGFRESYHHEPMIISVSLGDVENYEDPSDIEMEKEKYNIKKTILALKQIRFVFKYVSFFLFSCFLVSFLTDFLHPLVWISIFFGAFGIYGASQLRIEREQKHRA